MTTSISLQAQPGERSSARRGSTKGQDHWLYFDQNERNVFSLLIWDATAEEIDAIAAAINAPFERMRLQAIGSQQQQAAE